MILRLWKVVNKETGLRHAYEVEVRFFRGHAIIPADQIQGDDVTLDAGQCALLLSKLERCHEYRIKYDSIEKIPCEATPDRSGE